MSKENLKTWGKRNYLNWREPLAHVVWNLHNPDNPWKKGYVIHHKDGNSLNDDINNLELMQQGEHTRLHQVGNKNCVGRKASNETKEKLSKSHQGLRPWRLGLEHSEESKIKMSLIKKGKTLSEEHKRKISNSMKGKKNTLGFKHSDEFKMKMSKILMGNKRAGRRADD
jgi:hypothetical protein